MKFLSQFFAALALGVLCLNASAIDTSAAFDDPALQARYDHLIRELRCLKCRNQSIADSNDQLLAADLRRQVRELIAAGKSDAEVFQYMTDRYGDYVLFNPPVSPRTWLLWGAPVLLLGGGIAAAAVVIVRKSRLVDDNVVVDDDSLDSDQGVT